MTKERKKEIERHLAPLGEDKRRAVLRVFTKKHGADHEETQYVRSLVEGAPVATTAEIEADAGGQGSDGRGSRQAGTSPEGQQGNSEQKKGKKGG